VAHPVHTWPWHTPDGQSVPLGAGWQMFVTGLQNAHSPQSASLLHPGTHWPSGEQTSPKEQVLQLRTPPVQGS
jgi:hypothetical protein